ncbi:tryptophanyl-tRNA synthetase [Methanomethylovorans hollandica DSM 15978]|uniref:Tryptophan--tRNA ligase n=1 Tax=Methanomethylovorans hollandica (strain DSM 15978 / NBRC 107637 / DMS1) TaxID=867904 RepID=L0KY59_METHD|nr:tryptophan--tRNA ligase [Methanomethylovorans hollandica]AGB50377.1 tryptophanyl-tRNA synthetase [Methanomethylovorans hollandica DSM 15978]
MNVKIDPWSSTNIVDYSKLFEEFGIMPFDDLYPRIDNPHRLMRRKVIFGHRSYEYVLDAMQNKEPFAVMSGFMPSGHIHLGHKMVMEEIIWHQQKGADAFVGIADREAHSVRGISWEKCRDTGINEYIVSLIALGFEPHGHIYFQSSSDNVKDLSFELGSKANFSELSAIYGFTGETSVSHMVSAITQSADILHPQLEDHGGPKPTVIPVGADQDPHMRLTRGLAHKMNMFKIEGRENKDGQHYFSIRSKAAPQGALEELHDTIPGNTKLFEGHLDVLGADNFEELLRTVRDVELRYGGYAFVPPASTYHRFMSGLQGGKMSSSIPESHIALLDDPREGAKKVKRAKTGGRISLEEQKKLGGEPDKCSVYDLLLFHLLEDDQELLQIHEACVTGQRTCGSCKNLAAERMEKFLKEHQEKRELARERLDEYCL